MIHSRQPTSLAAIVSTLLRALPIVSLAFASPAGVMGRLSCCCTASGTPATCGSLRRQGVTDHVALAEILVKDHRVIIPDLRGMGLSSHPASGYEKVAQARDIAAVLDQLKVHKVDLVTHDIGNMVGYALAAQYSDRVSQWVVMDAPLPGLGTWYAQLTNPKVWHFNFRGCRYRG